MGLLLLTPPISFMAAINLMEVTPVLYAMGIIAAAALMPKVSIIAFRLSYWTYWFYWSYAISKYHQNHSIYNFKRNLNYEFEK